MRKVLNGIIHLDRAAIPGMSVDVGAFRNEVSSNTVPGTAIKRENVMILLPKRMLDDRYSMMAFVVLRSCS